MMVSSAGAVFVLSDHRTGGARELRPLSGMRIKLKLSGREMLRRGWHAFKQFFGLESCPVQPPPARSHPRRRATKRDSRTASAKLISTQSR